MKLNFILAATFVCVLSDAYGYKLRRDIKGVKFYCNEICKGCNGEASLTLDVCICSIDSKKTDVHACLLKARNRFTFLGIKWEGGRNKRSSESESESVEANNFIDEMPLDTDFFLETTTKSIVKRSLDFVTPSEFEEKGMEVVSKSDSSEENKTFKLYFADHGEEKEEASGLTRKSEYGFWYPSQNYDEFQYDDESSDWSSDYSESDEDCDGDEECERSDMKETNVFHLFQPRRATFHISPGSSWDMRNADQPASQWEPAFPGLYNQHFYYPKNYLVQFTL